MSKNYLGTAYVNGALTALEDAVLPISDRGFLFGHAVFETILISNGNIIEWEAHYRRLKNGGESIYINVPSSQELYKYALEVIQYQVKQTGVFNPKASLRLIITGGSAFDLKTRGTQPNIIFICRNVIGPSEEQYEEGVCLTPVFDVRSKPLLQIKSTNYLFSYLALESASEMGCEDALFYNEKDEFTESTTANFVWFDESLNFFYSPFENNALPGTTILRLISSSKSENILFRPRALKINCLEEAKGGLLVSSVRGLMPVKKIGDKSFDTKKYAEIFRKLRKIIEV